MSSTNNIFTSDQIIKHTDLPKVIVIGGGALGKTTLVRKITRAPLIVSETANDGTLDFQGALYRHNEREILIVDSPGFHLNEDRWWDIILQIKEIIGVIVMHKYEHRNSGYGRFGYVLAYLNQQEKHRVKKFLIDQSATTLRGNYMDGSISVQNSEHEKVYREVESWIGQLDEKNVIEIVSPVALIKQYQHKLDEIKELIDDRKKTKQEYEKTLSQNQNRIGRLEEQLHQLEEQRRQLLSEKEQHLSTISDNEEKIAEAEVENAGLLKSCDEYQNVLDGVQVEVLKSDDNSQNSLVNVPHFSHYLYSWLPFVGLDHLKLLRTNVKIHRSFIGRIRERLKPKGS